MVRLNLLVIFIKLQGLVVETYFLLPATHGGHHAGMGIGLEEIVMPEDNKEYRFS